MQSKEFLGTYGANPAKALRCVKPWFGSDRCVIPDSCFASLNCAKGMAENGLFIHDRQREVRPCRLPEGLATEECTCPRAKIFRDDKLSNFYR